MAAKKTFLRRSWDRYSKLGKGRKKKQKWKKPTGRDNKMREKRKGYPVVVSIGYKTNKENNVVQVFNVADLQKVSKESTIVVANVGKKKKIEIANKAKELGLKIQNMNVKKVLKKSEKKKATEQKKVEDKKDVKKSKVKEKKQ